MKHTTKILSIMCLLISYQASGMDHEIERAKQDMNKWYTMLDRAMSDPRISAIEKATSSYPPEEQLSGFEKLLESAMSARMSGPFYGQVLIILKTWQSKVEYFNTLVNSRQANSMGTLSSSSASSSSSSTAQTTASTTPTQSQRHQTEEVKESRADTTIACSCTSIKSE